MEIWVIVVKMVKVQVSIMDVLECCLASRMLSAGGVLTAHHEEVPIPVHEGKRPQGQQRAAPSQDRWQCIHVALSLEEDTPLLEEN